MSNELLGRKIAMLLAPKGTEQVEFTEPRNAIQNIREMWVVEEVITAQGLVTNRSLTELPAFCTKLVEEFAESRVLASVRSISRWRGGTYGNHCR